jgi:hypothetical protein
MYSYTFKDLFGRNIRCVNESRDLGYDDCQKMWDGFTKVCTLNEPDLPEGRIVIVISEFMIFPSCPRKNKTEVKKMETLGVIEDVSPMANCGCAGSCAACGSNPYSSITNTNNAIVIVDARNP